MLVQFGTNITSAAPGSAQGRYLIVSDIDAARDELAALGAKVSEVFHDGGLRMLVVKHELSRTIDGLKFHRPAPG